MIGTRSLLTVLLTAGSTAWLCAAAAGRAGEISFNRDIRPILSDNCFPCHGADRNARKAKLRLDLREVALDKGAILPGKPEKSELVARVFTDNEDDLMPPADSHKKLKVAEKELLKQWIAEGAHYEPHWSFITPTRPLVPKSGTSNSKFVNPIDAFILAELEKHKIAPSAEADRRTLLRRASLDLLGLPPSPREMTTFLQDDSRNAYEKQVERLLASPHFGERMAGPWLDVVRYADTVGYHGDQNQNIFPYRDYVINSFNENKRFDQFTLEQLAGDLLPNNTVEQRIATGFNRLNMVTREGGAQPKEYLAKYGADRVRTVGMAWLGLTVGCAECHDHKFDPFTTKDFYQLKAFFGDVKEWGVYNDYKYTPNPDLKDWSNDHPFPPEEIVDSPYLHRRIAKLRAEIAARAGSIAANSVKQKENFAAWRQSTAAALQDSPDGWILPEPIVVISTNLFVTTNKVVVTNAIAAIAPGETSGNASPHREPAPERQTISTNLVTATNVVISTNFTVEATKALLFGSKGDANPIALQLAEGWVAAIRLELLPHERHGGDIFSTGNR